MWQNTYCHYAFSWSLFLTVSPYNKSFMTKLNFRQKTGQRMGQKSCSYFHDLWNNSCFIKIMKINSFIKSLYFLATVTESISPFSFPFVYNDCKASEFSWTLFKIVSRSTNCNSSSQYSILILMLQPCVEAKKGRVAS